MKPEPDSGLRRNDEERSEVIFFSEKKLARKLHEGQVTEKEQMIYLALYVMTCVYLTTMSLNHSVYQNTSINMYSNLYDLVTLAFTLGTIIYCSFVNKQGDGKDTVARYICLTVPLIIKFIPLFIILTGIGYSLDNFSNNISNITKQVNIENEQEMAAYTNQMLVQMTQEGPFLVFLYVLYSLLLLGRYKVAFEIASGKVELK